MKAVHLRRDHLQPFRTQLFRAVRFTSFLLMLGGAAELSFAQPLPVIRQAPEVTFRLPGGHEKKLSDYRGKVVALEFILTTCSHCQAASHVLSKLQEDFGAKGFQALDVAVNTTDEGLVREFSTNQQTTFPVGWLDLGSLQANVQAMMQYMGMSPMDRPMMPQMLLIDRAGKVRYQTPPPSDHEGVSEPLLRYRVMELLGIKASGK